MKMLMVLSIASVFSTTAFSKPPYLNKFKAAYPDAKVLHSCKVCHIGTGHKEANDFGKDYSANTRDFKAIEGFDSDVDGFTNLEEMTAGTFPGDKDGHLTIIITPPTGPVPPTTPIL